MLHLFAGVLACSLSFFPKVDGLDRVTQRDGVRAGFWYVKRHPMAFPYI